MKNPQTALRRVIGRVSPSADVSQTIHTKLFAFLAAVILITGGSFSSLAQTKKPRTTKTPALVLAVPKAVTPSTANDAEAKTVGLAIERYVNTIEVESDGKFVQTWDVLQRIKSARALNLFKRFEKVFNQDLEEIEVSNVYILKADGTRVVLPASVVETKRTPQTEAAPSFSSMMMIEINFGGLKIGDAAHYSMKLRTKKTHFEGQFNSVDYLAAIFDWDSVEINLTAPVDYPIYTQAVGMEGGQLPNEGGRARWQWQKKNHKAIEIEPLMLDVIGTGARVFMTSFKDYETLGQAYWRTASPRAAVTPEIKTLADEITRGATGEEQQAYAIYQWVNKNIRYLFVIMDRSGWIPHDATQILANRYGDCKDYTTVLHALLAAKGIESYPVLIRADTGAWFPSVAVATYFNHAILYIPSLNMFADATAPNTRLGLIPQQIVGKKALLAGARTGVIETPSNRPDDSQVISKIDVDITRDGSIKALSKTIYKGRPEIIYRPLFGEIEIGSRTFVPAVLSFYGMQGKGRIVNVSNPFKVGEPFEVEVELELPEHTDFLAAGSFRIPLALNLNNILALGDYVKAETRKTDLMMGAVRLQEHFRIKFPAGVDVAAPQNTTFSNSSGSFRSEFKLVGRDLDLFRELVTNKDMVTVEDYPKMRELILKADEAFQTEIQYKADRGPRRAKERELARNSKAKAPALSAYDLFKSGYADTVTTTAQEARRLEARLLADPSDVDSRLKLVSFYSRTGPADTATRIRARAKHRLWLIENRPDLSDDDILMFKFAGFKPDSPEYASLRSAWLKQVEANKTNSAIRINAFRFLEKNDPAIAAGILIDGRRSDPDNYMLPLLLSQLYESKPEAASTESELQRSARLKNELEAGQTALTLLKKERSDDRDDKRRYLLQRLAQAAFDLKRLQDAASLATELVLDFGQNSRALGYDDATHIGNIVLGRVALQNKDTAKAREHLLIAIRAPLRRSTSWLGNIDTNLARELFEAGEKEAVIEYLKLCEGLSNLKTEKTLFENQSKALKLWQEQIKAGKTPTFDFYKL